MRTRTLAVRQIVIRGMEIDGTLGNIIKIIFSNSSYSILFGSRGAHFAGDDSHGLSCTLDLGRTISFAVVSLERVFQPIRKCPASSELMARNQTNIL